MENFEPKNTELVKKEGSRSNAKENIISLGKRVYKTALYGILFNAVLHTPAVKKQIIDWYADINLPRKIEWKVNLEESKKKEIEETIEMQTEWLESYIESDKFEERITKELLINKSLESNSNAVEESSTQKIISPDLSQLTSKDKKEVKETIHFRKLLVKHGKTIITDKIDEDENIIGQSGSDKENPLKIQYAKDFIEVDNSTPVHELTHQSTSGNDNMMYGTKFLLKERAVGGSEYLNKPTEIHARINQLRYTLKKLNIYDTSTEDFTEEHYNKIFKMGNEEILESSGIRGLLDTLDKDDLIWFMNNMAGTSVASIDIENTA